MRKFMINVNGKSYEVEVEEVGGSQAPMTATPAQAAVAAAPAADTSAPVGSTEVKAPMPGNIISVAVEKGQKVEKDDVLCVLEAMKMENEIKSPVAGEVVAVAVSKGATVNSGDLMIAIS